MKEIKTGKISIILPTLNEKGNIMPLIDEVHKQLIDYEHEIIVVDDDSPDKTYKIISQYNYPYLRTYLRKGKRGLAYTIRYGLEKATGENLIVMDSDFNHQPKYLSMMVRSLAFYDCVSASRFLYGGGMLTQGRQILSRSFNMFIRLMVGGRILDNLYGYFAIKRRTLEQCDYDDIFWGHGDYFMRLLHYLQKSKVNILQFPVINGRRKTGEGNKRFIRTFFHYLFEVFRLAYRARILRK